MRKYTPIPGWEGLYSISVEGEIYSHRNKRCLSPGIRSGYWGVTLCNNKTQKRLLVHRLVAMTYIPNPMNKPCVNHIDGDKKNANVKNLEWVTYQENEKHSFNVLGKRRIHSNETKEKMRSTALGRDMTKAVISSANKRRGNPAKNRMRVILNKTIVYDSLTDAAKENGILRSSISNNLKGLSKTTKVGIWEYY